MDGDYNIVVEHGENVITSLSSEELKNSETEPWGTKTWIYEDCYAKILTIEGVTGGTEKILVKFYKGLHLLETKTITVTVTGPTININRGSTVLNLNESDNGGMIITLDDIPESWGYDYKLNYVCGDKISVKELEGLTNEELEMWGHWVYLYPLAVGTDSVTVQLISPDGDIAASETISFTIISSEATTTKVTTTTQKTTTTTTKATTTTAKTTAPSSDNAVASAAIVEVTPEELAANDYEITVPLYSNKAFTKLAFGIEFPEELEYVKASSYKGMCAPACNGDFIWYPIISVSAVSAGEVGYVTFRLPSDAAVGDSYTLDLQNAGRNGSPAEYADANGNESIPDCIDGKIAVVAGSQTTTTEKTGVDVEASITTGTLQGTDMIAYADFDPNGADSATIYYTVSGDDTISSSSCGFGTWLPTASKWEESNFEVNVGENGQCVAEYVMSSEVSATSWVRATIYYPYASDVTIQKIVLHYSNGTTTTTTKAKTTTTKATTSTTAKSSVLYGDINLDGRVDITDAVQLNKACSGSVSLNESAAANADCNADGGLGSDDAVVLLQFLVSVVKTLPYKA